MSEAVVISSEPQVGQGRTVLDFTMLLKTACYLKFMDFFWNFHLIFSDSSWLKPQNMKPYLRRNTIFICPQETSSDHNLRTFPTSAPSYQHRHTTQQVQNCKLYWAAIWFWVPTGKQYFVCFFCFMCILVEFVLLWLLLVCFVFFNWI